MCCWDDFPPERETTGNPQAEGGIWEKGKPEQRDLPRLYLSLPEYAAIEQGNWMITIGISFKVALRTGCQVEKCMSSPWLGLSLSWGNST
jgi:hypothetical protein